MHLLDNDLSMSDIKVLILMAQYQSVSVTAKHLGKTPSAISKKLSKLRLIYQDPLFSNSRHGFESTAKLRAILPLLHTIEQQYEQTIALSDTFEPEKYKGKLSIDCSMSIIERFGDTLLTSLESALPLCTLSLNTWSSSSESGLKTGNINAGIHLMNIEKSKAIAQKTLLDDEVVIAVRHDHPAHTMEKALSYPAIIIRASGWNDSKFEFLNHMQKAGVDIDSSVYVDQISLALKLLHNSDRILFVPKSVISASSLRFIVLEKALFFPFKFVYCCKSTEYQSSLHRWLYQQCKNIIS